MPSPPVSLDVTVLPVLTRALAWCRVNPLGPVRITNHGPAAPGSTLRVTVSTRSDPHATGGAAAPTPDDAVLGSVTVPVDLPAQGTMSLAVPSPLDRDALATVTAPVAGKVRAEILVGGQVVAESESALRILAADQWAAVPVTLAVEVLAAFVTPQDPALDQVTGAALAPLAAGYPAGPDDVDRQVREVVGAVRSRAIGVLAPGTGWPHEAQRVRAPGRVLEERAGSPLEIALLLAAAIERCRLHPQVWITDGGPLVGYWRQDGSLPAVATTDTDGVVNLLDVGLLGCLDPISAVASVEGGTAGGTADGGVGGALASAGTDGGDDAAGWFEQAAAAARRRLRGDGTGALAVLDVAAARRDGIDPLPVQVPAPDGSVRTVPYQPAPSPTPTDQARPTPRVVEPGAPTEPPPTPPRVTQWKNALLDLSLRNRLLNYSDRGAVHLAVPPGMLASLEDTVNGGGAITLLPADQMSDVQARRGIRSGRDLTEEQRADLLSRKHSAYTDIATESYPARMRSLIYRARTIVEETGANHLYLALGTLVWNLDGRDLRSPLVLVPVTLTQRSRHSLYRIEMDEAGTSTPNYCLIEKLRQIHGVTMPGLAEPAPDSAGIDLDAAFRALRFALADAGLNYRVEQTADLALLAFAKFRLWKDLDDHWPDLARNPLVNHLITAPTTPFTDPAGDADDADLDALARQLPIAADGSQLDAVAAAAAGHTFVLEGPPGTGKSQTITNLLAHAVASGRRVLFVAEKRAALDVVTRRLDTIGLAPFCLDLHDKGAKPAAVRAQVRTALELRATADAQGLAAATERWRAAGADLARYAQRLHQPNSAGLSYYSAHTQALAVGDGAVLPVPHSAVATAGADLANVRAALVELPGVADPAGPRPGHPWGFVDPPNPAGADPESIATATVSVDSALSVPIAAGEVAAALDAARGPRDVADLARFAGGFAVDLALLDEAATDRWRDAAAAALAEVATFASAQHVGLDLATPEVFDLPVDAIDAAARAAATSSWFGRHKRQRAVLAQLEPALRPGVSVARKHLVELTRQLAATWKTIVELQMRVAAVSGLGPPDGWNPLTDNGRGWLTERIGWLTWASDTAAIRDARGNRIERPTAFRLAVRHLLESRVTVGLDDRDALNRMAAALSALAEIAGGDAPFAAWASGGLLAAWRRTAEERDADGDGHPALRRYLALLERLAPLHAAGLHDARALLLSGSIPAGDAARAFDAGVAAASLAEREMATGLGAFERSTQDRAVRTFTRAADEVREQLVTAIPAAVVASRTFDSTSSFGRIGELSRELVKQRRGLTVRGLLARYGDLVTAVMPCLLVSPDSLARFLPPRPDLFDLVVFDEASQIRVADAVGALGRARAAVIAGDSKQMPPTSVAESIADAIADPGSDGWGSDDDVTGDLLAVPDEESILSECVQAGVPRRWLSWHYRSQDEALIAFSNRRYYDDRLSTFPSPLPGTADPGVDGHGISLVRIPGRFLRSGAGKLLRTNPTEAAAVVTEIRRRFDPVARAGSGAVPSIGIVTFNAPQRTLIESLLRDLDDDTITNALDRTDGEGLFVKNLENVQGDERDVILFSTAFSANDRGVLPLNFGPLNQIGGERRLNVAVTRARRQVVVYSSFDPEDLRSEDTSSQGIKDLRAYLEVARDGAESVIGTSPKAPAADRHRDEIAAAASARGLAVATSVGLSGFTLDLVVGPALDPDGVLANGENPTGDGVLDAQAPQPVTRPTVRPTVAVLLDGPEWASRRTVGDRDGIPTRVLAGLMRWPAVERIWLPDWLRDPGTVLDRLQAVANLGPVLAPDLEPPAGPTDRADTEPPAEPVDNAAPEPSAGQAGSPPEPPSAEPADDAAPEPGPAAIGPVNDERPFTPWISGYLGSRSVLDRLPDAGATDQVRQALCAAIQVEGPVHVDRLAKLVAGGFDLSRVSTDRRSAILQCLPAAVFRDRSDPEFAWPDELDPATWTGFRATGRYPDRPLQHVCAREIGNAMMSVCVAGAGVGRDQLESETLRIFGLTRRTAALLALLDSAIQRTVAQGRLSSSNGVFRAA